MDSRLVPALGGWAARHQHDPMLLGLQGEARRRSVGLRNSSDRRRWRGRGTDVDPDRYLAGILFSKRNGRSRARINLAERSTVRVVCTDPWRLVRHRRLKQYRPRRAEVCQVALLCEPVAHRREEAPRVVLAALPDPQAGET